MSDLLDELEGIHVFSEGGDSPKHGESEEEQVIMRPRESFLMVRKPTKRRLFSPKTENDAKIELSSLPVATESRVLNIMSQNDTHEDEPPSANSLSTDKGALMVPFDREIKDRNQHVSNKDSRFRASRFQHSPMGQVGRKTTLNGSSLNDAQDASNLSLHEKKGKSGADSSPTRKSILFGSRLSFKRRQSEVGINIKYIRAINDKTEFLNLDEAHANGEATDRRQLRGLLKKYAAKRRRTFDVSDLLKKLKQSQSQPVLTRITTRAKEHFMTVMGIVGQFFKKLGEPVNPSAVFLNIWETMILFMVIYELIAIPIEMAFDLGLSRFFLIIDWIETIWFFLDLLLNFHTAYNIDGVYIAKHRDIASYYLRSWFLTDLIALLPIRLSYRYNLLDGHISVFSLFGLFRTLKIWRIVKVFRIGQAFSRLKHFVKISGELNGVMRLIRLWVVTVFLIHWVACFWHLMGEHSIGDPGETWIIANNLQDFSPTTRYVKSLYWATATLLTVGYGDIVATNNGENVYSVFVMLLGSAVVGFSMNQIGDILQQINSETNYKEKKFQELQKFMEKNEIDPKLQTKAKQYIEFKLEHERTMRETDKAVLDSLSQSLRDQMLKQINGRVMKNSEFFQKSFGTNFLTKLAMVLDEQLLAPDEFIYHENELVDFSLYFIARGKVEMLLEKYSLSLATVNKGLYFGELSFFTGNAREASARTLTFCSIFSLSLSKFNEVLDKFPSDREMYYFIKDQVNLLQENSLLGAKCLLCDDKKHLVQNCHYTHYVADKQTIIQKHLQDQKEFAEKFKRRNRPRFHVLTRKVNVNEATDRVHTLKNQATTSMTDASGTLNHIRKSRKQITNPHDDFEDLDEDNIEVAYSAHHTLARIKDEDIGITKLVKPNRWSHKFDSHADLNRSVTMRQSGEAIFMPLKVKITEETRNKLDEVVIDQVKNYEIYFPHNNIRKVIEQIEYSRSKKKTLKLDFNDEQDIAYFKMKLGKIFEKNKKGLKTMGSSSSIASSIIQKPQKQPGTPQSPHRQPVTPQSPQKYARKSVIPAKKRQSYLPYVKKRSNSVKDDILIHPPELIRKASSKRKNSWTGS